MPVLLAKPIYYVPSRPTVLRPLSLQHRDEQHQNHHQHYDDRAALIIIRPPRNLPKPVPCATEPALVAVDVALDLVEHEHVLVELVADARAQLALPADRRAQPVQLVVLLRQHLRVVRVDLLVGEAVRVRHGEGRVGLVAVGEERLARGVRGGGRGVVAEAYGFGGGARRGGRGGGRGGGGVREVGRERGVVGLRDGAGGWGLRGAGGELSVQLGVLGAQLAGLVLNDFGGPVIVSSVLDSSMRYEEPTSLLRLPGGRLLARGPRRPRALSRGTAICYHPGHAGRD